MRKDKRSGGAADKSPASVVGRTAQGHFIRNEENEKVRFFLDLSIACDILKALLRAGYCPDLKKVYITCLKTGNVKDRLYKF